MKSHSKLTWERFFNRVLAMTMLIVAATLTTSSSWAQDGEPKLRMIKSNGINMRIAEMGEGPLVVLVHGWPESWYSWRHQLPALAKAGYHAVAPDMRGYGKTDAAEKVEDYDIEHLTADIVGVIDAMGEETAIVIGHDWGSFVAWNCMLLHPDRFTALVAMSVPYGGRAKQSPVDSWRTQHQDNFFYILYFQEPDSAENEFDADPHAILSRLYLSPDSPRDPPVNTNIKRISGGWIDRLGAPKGLPDWLTQKDLDYYVNEFTEAGFRGGINYYRNFHRNWEITPQLNGAKVKQPVLFLAGEKDVVIGGANAAMLKGMMSRATSDLRDVTLIPKAGHWVQQELPNETNEAILEFLASLKK
jgi:pimeloyl-ACP methyl ester carboxylesterase